MNNTITIVTPSLNQGRFIEQTINSVLSQEGDFFIDYIIADGGSTDNSVEIIKKYDRLLKNKKYPIKCKGISYRWWSKLDKGQTDAINKGLAIAKGDWFAWINSDDFYEPNIFSKLVEYFKKFPNAGVIYGNCYEVDKNGKKIKLQIPKTNPSFKRLKKGNCIYGPASFYNIKTIKKVGKFDETLDFWMDYEMYLRISKLRCPLQYINLNIANFRIQKGEQKSTNPKFRKSMKKERNKIQKKYRTIPEIWFIYSIKNTKKQLIKGCKNFSFLRNIYKKMKNIILYSNFINDWIKFKKMSKKTRNRFHLSWRDRYPCLKGKTAHTKFDTHYIYHLAWATRILANTKPETHIDISSSLHFCSIVSAFIPVKFYDYRPANLILDNLSSEYADLLSLPFKDNGIKSLSCMHTVEHIGLGRYGEPIDPDGDLKAISELKRVLAQNGDLLFVVPIGKPKILFNAHRIYSYEQIKKYFSDLKLKEFSLIPDNAKDVGIIKNASAKEANKQTYGCGCFWFKK